MAWVYIDPQDGGDLVELRVKKADLERAVHAIREASQRLYAGHDSGRGPLGGA